MSFDEILDYIGKTSPKDDWYRISRNDVTECFLKIDPRLRFRIRYSGDGVQNENFDESWANNQPDPNASGYWCDLSYNGDFLDRIILVLIDGGRATLPVPERNTYAINKYDYHVAKIFDEHNTLDEYIRISGLNLPY